MRNLKLYINSTTPRLRQYLYIFLGVIEIYKVVPQ